MIAGKTWLKRDDWIKVLNDVIPLEIKKDDLMAIVADYLYATNSWTWFGKDRFLTSPVSRHDDILVKSPRTVQVQLRLSEWYMVGGLDLTQSAHEWTVNFQETDALIH